MGSFADFRKKTGLSAEELAELTGYSRQALTAGFRHMDQGLKPSKRFFRCIEAALNIKIEKETQEFNDRIESLNNLKREFAIKRKPTYNIIEFKNISKSV
jgi:transcriptional regulator with XRE-family HTH domain